MKISMPDIDFTGSGTSEVDFLIDGAPTLHTALLTGALQLSDSSNAILGSIPVAIQYVSDGKSYTQGTRSTLVPVGPVRFMDTRSGKGVRKGAVGPNAVVKLKVAGVGGVPASGVTAVVMNVTVTGGSAKDYVTVYPDGVSRPGTSSVNFGAGQTLANLVTVKVVDGYVDFYNYTGNEQIIADVSGYYSATGDVFVPVTPNRILDSRTGIGGFAQPIDAADGGIAVAFGKWFDGIPPYGATAVTLNVTVTDTTSSGYVSVVPEGADGLGVSSLNFTRGQTLSNQVVSGPGSGYVAFDLSAGTADLVADVLGYYTS